MKKRWISFILVIVLLPVLAIYSAITGSIEITAIELIQGLISGEDNRVDIIKDLRFPRIIIALFAGAMLSVSGVLLQRSEERRVGKEWRFRWNRYSMKGQECA